MIEIGIIMIPIGANIQKTKPKFGSKLIKKKALNIVKIGKKGILKSAPLMSLLVML